MYKLVDQWTTRDGRWEVDNREYGLDQEHFNQYGSEASYLGGATHIYAKTLDGPSNTIRFFTRDNQNQEIKSEEANGWANVALYHSSAYKPDKGEIGWWNVEVSGAPSQTIEGIGLPYSWHVSHFLVFEWDEAGEDEEPELPDEGPEIPENPPTSDSIWVSVFIGDKTYAGWLEPVQGDLASVG
jgi:hypothetical protein